MSKGGSTASKGLQKCVECGSTGLTSYENDRIIICTDCGFVTTADTAGHNPERNSGSKRRKTNDTNAYMKTLTPHNIGFTTLDSRYDIDGDLREHDTLGGRLRNHFLEMWWKNARVSDATEKNLALAFSEITKIGDILSLPKSVLEKAATTYKMIVEKRCVRGRNIQALSAAAVHMACKQCGFARTLNEVAMASKISRRKVGRGYRFLIEELGCSIPPVKPAHYLMKFLKQITISEKNKEITDKILEVANELKLTSGRGPMGIVAAAIYIASLLTGERKTQREIAEIARITEATIRNRYKELVKILFFTMAM